MAFPSNPSDGDTYIRYGRTYEYEAALSMWKVLKSGIQLTELSDVDITTTTPVAGDALVWSGTKFEPDNINLLSVYQSELPLSGNVAGQMAYVTDTSRLYIYTGAGWFNVALVNTNPTITVGPDGSYVFATDGTPIVLTLEAQDPEELPITWSYAVTSGSLGNTATVSQADNVFTITPSTDQNDTGEFSITFTASDGVNLATAVSSFTLLFSVADQYYNSTSLLVKSGSTAGLNNNTFVDESTNGFTVTPTGDVHQGSLSPYSPAGWSNYFDGTGDRVDMPGADFSGDFTMEEWVYWPSTFTGNRLIATNRGGIAIAGPGQWWIDEYNNAIRFYFDDGARIDISETFPKGQWFHWAITRAGSTVRVFINGVQKGTATTTNDLGTTARTIKLGGFTDNTAYSFGGYQSNFRTVEGTALYTSNFTPPTEPLTAISGTSLLTCQSNRFIDNSTNNFTITKTGDTKLVPFSPHLPSEKYDPTIHGGSAYFDGTGDYLLVPTSSDLQPQSADFTAECWVNCTATAGSYTGVMAMNNINTGRSWRIWFAGENAIHCDLNSQAGTMIATGNFIGQWIHVAYVKQGSTNTFYINGTARATYTTTTVTSTSDPLIIGAENDAASPRFFLTGYISNVRIAKAAIYTSDFTPPTEPLTAVSGTSLLLNMSNAGIYDEMSKNNIKTVGNATTSTTQTKYSDTSVYFDGTGDRLIVPSSPNFDFPGNFTIEMWINFANVTSTWEAIISRAYNIAGGWRLYKNDANNQLRWYSGGTSVVLTTGSTLANNTWSHIAVVRNNGTVTIYIDGVSRGSAANTTSYIPGNYALEIGEGVVTSAYPFEGYMQDLRITKGVARYTANFTPPTAALGFYNAE